MSVSAASRNVLTVSGFIAADIREKIANGACPRADYLELADSLNADLIDYMAAREIAGRVGGWIEKLGGLNLVLAYACWKKRNSYRAIVTDGEQVGLPLAALFKFTPGQQPCHLMIVHVISEPKKTVFLDWLGVQSTIDRFITYSRWQQQFIWDRWNIDRERVLWTPFMVDQEFFSPERATARSRSRPQICAVGLERRDYETLLQAVANLDVDVVIAAASPWSKRAEGFDRGDIPGNVTVRKFSQYELRQLYADSSFMVMPLEDVKFQAGVTAILECMAMQKAVVCSRVAGQADVVVEDENGRYVTQGDPLALNAEIRRLLADPEQATRLGISGRDMVEREMGLGSYTKRMAAFLKDAIETRRL